MDNIDLTSVESKAIYEQIQNYVLEKYDFKVSTLYIAQVKIKYGLEVRKHYNISKNRNQKVPQCPIEKEEAILAALKHFKMISWYEIIIYLKVERMCCLDAGKNHNNQKLEDSKQYKCITEKEIVNYGGT